MRKIAVAILAVPVLVLIYAPVVFSRSVVSKVGAGLGVGAIIWIAAFASFAPHSTVAIPPSVPEPVAAAHFTPDVRYHQGLRDPVSVTFASAMNRETVESSLSVTPSAAVALSWNPESTTLTLTPTDRWAPGTYYSVAIAEGARNVEGHALAEPARTAFLTRRPTEALLSANRRLVGRVATTTSFGVAFDQDVDVASAEAAFRIDPPVAGAFSPSRMSPRSGFSFQPLEPLAPDTTYSVTLDSGVLDDDGALAGTPHALQVRTALAPDVVRFRPLNGKTKVARDALISVRFTDPMSRTSTAPALTVTANGSPVRGKISWAERNTVLVFDPARDFAYSAVVKVTVDSAATSREGTPLATARTGSFKVEANPRKPRAAGTSRTVPISRSAGSTAGRATWYAVEVYYLRLMNCTRTGGWVTSTGSCSSPGGLSTPPIVLDAGLSNKVARPYARLLATRNICSHFADGSPTTRLNRAGYSGWAAENIGCRWASNAYASVLGTHLFYQAEKPCSGFCHYANLMNPAYKRCGIGVWVYGGRVRLVVDFYHP